MCIEKSIHNFARMINCPVVPSLKAQHRQSSQWRWPGSDSTAQAADEHVPDTSLAVGKFVTLYFA